MSRALALFLAASLAATAPAQENDAFDQNRVAVPDRSGSGFKKAPFQRGRREGPEIIRPVETEPRAGATIRKLDKMTGATETLEIAAGGRVEAGRLSIAVAACMAPPDNAIKGTRAFLQIWDRRQEGGAPAFSGWMFADSPALSALDHPRFDVWVISCTTS